MKLAPLALAALLLAPLLPSALAETAPSEFPPEMKALLAKWVGEQEALLTEDDRARPWFPEADEFLQRAKNASAAGRVREGMFHLETFHEILVTKRLLDEGALLTNDGDRRLLVLQRLRAVHSDAEIAWGEYRERLHGYDGAVRSLHAVETAVYSSEIALGSMVGAQSFQPISDAFAKERGFPEGYVMALARTSATALVSVGWANDILGEAAKLEGLPPRLVDEGWTNVSALALASGVDRPPAHLEGIEVLADPARANNESLLAIGFMLATQRAARISSMETIFGDATSRNPNVANDTARYMAAQANNTTLEAPRSFGLLGLFTSDALDRVRLTQEYHARGKAGLEVIFVAWAALDHQSFATTALGRMSPIQPPPPEANEAPGVGALALVALVALVAALARRR